MSGVSVKNSAGVAVVIGTVTLPDGNQAPVHVLCDANGIPYSATHPLLTAPAIYPAAPVDRSGMITAPNAVALDVAANFLRKGG